MSNDTLGRLRAETWSVGFVAPGLVFEALAGLAHFVWGLMHGLGDLWPSAEARIPRWLTALAVVGALLGLSLSRGLWW